MNLSLFCCAFLFVIIHHAYDVNACCEKYGIEYTKPGGEGCRYFEFAVPGTSRCTIYVCKNGRRTANGAPCPDGSKCGNCAPANVALENFLQLHENK